MDKSLVALTKELNAKQTKLNSLTKKLQKSQSDGKNSKLTNLLKEKEELEKSNKALSEKLATLDASIKSSTALLNNNQQQLINLENIQEKVSNDILRENGDYLKLPFSKMKDSDLLKIKEKRGAEMSNSERENWIINIENTASYIASEIGEEVVVSTLYKFGAASIDQVVSSDLAEVFSELYAIETDLRSGDAAGKMQ